MDATEFRKMFPAFKSVEDGTIELWKNVADEYLKASWMLNGKQFNTAIKLMTAHLIHCNCDVQGNGEEFSDVGVVVSASEGSVSASFAAPPTKNAWQHWLASSPYGLQLWALLKQLSASGFYVGGLPERRAVRKVGGVFV